MNSPHYQKLAERGHTLNVHRIFNSLCKLTEGSIRCERRGMKSVPVSPR